MGHLVAGMGLARELKWDEARLHFSIAYGLAPQVGLLLVQSGLRLAELKEPALEVVARRLGRLGLEFSKERELALLGVGKITYMVEGSLKALEFLEPYEGQGSMVDQFLVRLRRETQ